MKNEYKIRRWLGDRYYLNTELTWQKDKLKTGKWKLFRAYSSFMENNIEPIMTSETHTDKDLMNFAKKNKIYDLSFIDNQIFIIICWINLIISISNSYFHNVFIRGFNWGINITIIITLIIKGIFIIHNKKIEDKDFKEEIKHLENNLKKRLQKIEKQNISKIAIINKEVDHQGIGGKEIILEKEMIVKEFLDTNFNEMSIAMFNFIKRRLDFINEENENKKVYYGHVGNLGYFVAEDEIEIK